MKYHLVTELFEQNLFDYLQNEEISLRDRIKIAIEIGNGIVEFADYRKARLSRSGKKNDDILCISSYATHFGSLHVIHQKTVKTFDFS